MLPAGEVTQLAIDEALPLLSPGDVLVDGANSFYKNSIARAQTVEAAGIHYVDAGVSGGIRVLDNGYALRVGGSKQACRVVATALRVRAPEPQIGWFHCGSAGSRHFVKVVHNGIEHGMMRAYGEGFALMQSSGTESA